MRESIKGGCTEPGTGDYCNWGEPCRQLHPVNCVDWDQATQYARFKGVRLPSEAEFEYAATSGGRNQKYPWGNDEPTCDKAVMRGNGGYGCGTNSTMPVCSKPKGNTAQGLCDMAGNVLQWTQDKYLGFHTKVRLLTAVLLRVWAPTGANRTGMKVLFLIDPQ